MIVPLVFMFQILLSGSLYATQIFLQLSRGNVQFKNYYQLLLHLISQVTLQKVVTQHHLTADYFEKFSMVQMPGYSYQGKKCALIFRSHLLVVVHQEQIPFFPKPMQKSTQQKELPVRPHRFDKYKLFQV